MTAHNTRPATHNPSRDIDFQRRSAARPRPIRPETTENQPPRPPVTPRWLALGSVMLCAAIMLWAAPSACAEETSEQLLKRIDVLLAKPDLTEAESDNLIKLLDRYADTRAKENTEGKNKPAPKPTPKAASKSKPKAASKSTPKTTPKSRRVSRPRKTAKPKETPKPTKIHSGRKRRSPSVATKTPGRSGATTPAARGSKPSTGVAIEPELNIDANLFLKPYNERVYEFSVKDGTYAELLELFARMAGLEFFGNAPEGTVSFVSTSPMDFKTALGRLQMLLFEHRDQYWIQLVEDTGKPYLEIFRVTDVQRDLPLKLIFNSLERYRAANLADNELALLLYAPEEGSIADLEPLRDFMPDYVRIAQYKDENAITIIALVRDINKYLELIDIFNLRDNDPRRIKVIPIEHVLPSEALTNLRKLMTGFDAVQGAPARKRKSGQTSVAAAQARGIDAIPFDERGKLFVRAVPSKIEEIEGFLIYIDVPAGTKHHEPVVVMIQNANAGQVLTLVQSLMGGSKTTRRPSVKNKGRKSKSKRRLPKPAATSTTEELTMIEWPESNAIVLIGEEEQVAEAQRLIARFDVPVADTQEFIKLENREPTEITQRLTQLIPDATQNLICTADDATSSILLSGKLKDIAIARDLIARLDTPSDNDTTIHTIRVHNVRPNVLIGILNAYDSGTAPPPAPAPRPSPKNRKNSRRRRANAGTKFFANDDAGVLQVVCSEEEWAGYKPLIEKLDQELKPGDEYVILPLEHIEPSEAQDALQGIFATPKGGVTPQYLPVPDGLMVMGATPTQIERMKSIVAQIDVPDVEIRRIFELAHADPNEIITLLNSAFSSSTAPARKGKKRGSSRAVGGKSKQPRYVAHGGRLLVWASSRDMDEIAQLIADVDVPEVEREMRVYEFAVGTSVNDLANALRQFYPTTGRVVRTSSKGSKRRGKRSPQATRGAGADDQILIVPQPETRKLFVSAPVDMFEDIESSIEKLRPDATQRPGLVTEFFSIEAGDPDGVTALIEPIMNAKIDEMIATGELADPGKTRKSLLTITPDTAAKRIIVTAPNALMPEIKTLIERLKAGEYGNIVVRRIALINAAADEMATTINAMLSGKAPRPRRAGRGKGKGKRRAAVTARTDKGVTVVAAPGNDALVLTGLPKDVDEAESWIKMLDDGATGGKVMKVYQLQLADVEELADVIMTVLDEAPAKRAKPAASDDDAFDLNLGGPRKGRLISLTTNYYTNTMIVWASPHKMVEIDDLVQLYESEESEIVAPPMPRMLVNLEYAEAFDAMYELEDIISALWEKDKPKVDYIPFQNTLVIKSRNPDKDFPEVKKLIAQYIDKESEDGSGVRGSVAIKGAKAEDVLKILLTRLDNVDVEIDGGLDVQEHKGLLDEITPDTPRCVLPAVLTRALDGLAASAIGQSASTDLVASTDAANATSNATSNGVSNAASNATSNGAASPPSRDDLIQDVLRAGASGDVATKHVSGKKPLRIRVDPRTNTIIFEGSAKDVSDVKNELRKIRLDLEDQPQMPDIRVWRLKYVDPNVASEVLQAMFNAGAAGARGRAGNAAQQRVLQQRQMMQAMQKAQQQQAQKNQGDAGGEQGGRGGRKKKGKDDKGDKPQAVAAPTPSIQVFPYPSLRAIIVKAPTEMYPAIEELVATIDRKSDSTSDFRFFKIKNQLASDVEKQLKTIFNIGQQGRSRARRAPRRGNANASAQAVQDMLRQQINLAQGAGGVSSSESVTITSNDSSNTVLVRGPAQILELAEEIIAKIEENAPAPKVELTIELRYADAKGAVAYLDKLFAAGKSRGKSGSFHPSDITDVVFFADTLNNAVIVRALEDDLPKIKSAIAKIDLPPNAGQTPRLIKLSAAKASVVAKTINVAMDFGKNSGSRVRVTGNDSLKQLVVVAPDDIFARIEDFAHQLDAPAEELRMESYPLKYAKATDVLKQMNEMVRSVLQQIRGTNIQMDTFSATADPRANALIVMGGPITHGLVKQAIEEIDVEGGNTATETMVVMLKKSRARDVVKNIRGLFAGRKDGFDPPKAESNDTTNTLFVRGTKAQLEEIRRDIIAKLEDQPEQEQREARVYHVQYANLNEVRASITTAFRLERGAADTDRVDVSVENGTRSVIVTAKASKHEEIAALIKDIDVEGGASTLVRHVYKMKEGKASQVAEVMTRTINETRRGRQGPPVSVVSNNNLNMLVITSTQKAYDDLLPLIEQLDQPPLGGGLEPRVYPITFADPSSLIGTINNSFPRVRGQRSGDLVKASYTRGTNSLVVVASTENHEKIQELIAQVDQESAARRSIHVVPLENANAKELARNLTSILSRAPRRRDDKGVSVVADPDTNALLVSANEQELARVKKLVETLDVKPKFKRVIKSFKLAFAKVGPTGDAVTEFFVRSRGKKSSPKDEVAVVVDWATNSLVVAAAPVKMNEVADFIGRLDQEGAAGREVHVVTLKHADAQGAVRSLQDMFQIRSQGGRGGKGGKGSQQTVSISSPQGSDALFIKANEEEFAEIQAVIEQLDVLPNDTDRQVRMFTLQYIDAGEMETIIQDYMSKPGSTSQGRGRGRGRSQSRGRGRSAQVLLGGLRVSTIPASNTLVVSGEEVSVTRVAGLIEQLDVEIENSSTAPKIIKLEKALASEVEPTLTKMFIDSVGRGGRGGRGGGRGRNGRSGQSSAIQTVVVANDASNSLIVRASAADYNLIEKLAHALDAVETDLTSRVKLIRVSTAFRVTDLAPTIENTLRQASMPSGQSGSSRGRSRSRGRGSSRGRGGAQVSVEPIITSNSLLIAGNRKQLALAEALIADIQKMGPMGGRRQMIVNIKNMSATEIKRVIDELKSQNKSQGSRRGNRSGVRRGGSRSRSGARRGIRR